MKTTNKSRIHNSIGFGHKSSGGGVINKKGLGPDVFPTEGPTIRPKGSKDVFTGNAY